MTNAQISAPTVILPRDGGETFDIASLRPAPVVLFFYPKDNTPGCTNEAIAFTNLMHQFTAKGAHVIGISKDSVASHEKFIAKHGLKMPLLSDEHGTVCEDFGVWKEKSMYGKTFWGVERSTFIIGGNGEILREWRKVKVEGHAQEVLEAL